MLQDASLSKMEKVQNQEKETQIGRTRKNLKKQQHNLDHRQLTYPRAKIKEQKWEKFEESKEKHDGYLRKNE